MSAEHRSARTGCLGLAVGLLCVAALVVTACGSGARAASPDQHPSPALGAWHATVTVEGSASTFDALYAFAGNGTFTRVDGRNNAPGLGAWTAQGSDSVTFTFVVFQFDATGKRAGTITATAEGTVQGDKISGPFDAKGTDPTGAPLAGFPKHGTFEGVRIKP